jgi:tetratricopeptide (TPR) repeat protein
VGKAIASISVALSGVFIYLTCRLYAPIYSALAITLAYALGTAVWSVSSQNLWQHSFLELFLAAGTFFYCLDRRWSSPILTSICYAAAVCCRPTTAMFVVAAAVDYLLRDRVRWVLFTLAGVPIGLAFLYYNHRYFGSPFVFGQTPTDHPEVIAIGGPGNVWKTPFWYGLSAHLFLPARGLLFYSPFLLFSFWGAIRSWKMPQFRLIRYLIFGVLFIFLVQSFFVDWWSGFSYMYRHTVDTVPALAVFLLPVFQDWGRRLWWKCTFGFFVAYAFAMQLVGVTIYDVTGWNARLGTVAVLPHASPEYRVGVDRLGDQLVQHQDLFVVPMNIDRKQFRHRLWSLQDHQIRYYLSHPDEARRRREDWFRQMMRSREERLADTHTRVGDAYRLLGDRIRADKHYRRALQVNPHHGPAQMGQLLAFHPIHEAPLRSLVDQCRLSPDEKPYRLIEEGLQLLPVYPIDGFGLLEEAIRREPVLTLEVLASYLFVPAAGHLLENNDQAPDLAAVRGRNRAILWTVAAWQEIHRRDAERATEFLQQATLADPTLPWAPWRLGQILLARGEFARAIPPLESALRLGLRGAEEASAWDGLGQAKEKLNDPAGADQCRRRAEQIDPRGNARAWYRMQQVEMIPDP